MRPSDSLKRGMRNVYSTVEDIKKKLGIPPEDTGDDVFISGAIAAVAQWIDAYTRRTWTGGQTEQRFYWLPVNRPDLHIDDAQNITEVLEVQFDGTSTNITDSIYWIPVIYAEILRPVNTPFSLPPISYAYKTPSAAPTTAGATR